MLPIPEAPEKSSWWLVGPTPMEFDNIGFSKTVDSVPLSPNGERSKPKKSHSFDYFSLQERRLNCFHAPNATLVQSVGVKRGERSSGLHAPVLDTDISSEWVLNISRYDYFARCVLCAYSLLKRPVRLYLCLSIHRIRLFQIGVLAYLRRLHSSIQSCEIP